MFGLGRIGEHTVTDVAVRNHVLAQAELVREKPQPAADDVDAPQFTYRHGNGSAEILKVELLNASHEPVAIVESGQLVQLRMQVIFNTEVLDPVYGFIIRNRHGIHLYGTNTRVQGVRGGLSKCGARVETTFSFNCWLAPDLYSISIAVHSPEAVSFDWLDGALFFRVISAIPIEGVANLNATATTEPLDSTTARTISTIVHSIS